MKNVISKVEDINLDVYKDITRNRGTAELTPTMCERIDKRRDEFKTFVTENRSEHLYGITTRQHTGAKRVLNDDELKEFGSRLPAVAATMGPALPDRLTRGIVLTRIIDYVNGTSCPRSVTVQRILDMLQRDELPKVPSRGNGECGDIILLHALFDQDFDGTLEVGEGMTFINGSPVSAAILSDIYLQVEPYINTCEKVFALAAMSAGAPMMHYDKEFDTLWKDEYMGESLAHIRGLLEGSHDDPALNYQAPVSFRSAPRLFGWFRRQTDMLKGLASIDLTTSKNNPAFFGPEVYPPYGKVCSNGGYHTAYGPQINVITNSIADLTQLVTSVNNRVVEMPNGLQEHEDDPLVTVCFYASCGWAEEARTSTMPTIMSLAAGGQGDTGTNDVIAWRNCMNAALALEADTGCLAVSAAHLCHYKGMELDGELADLQKKIMEIWPVGLDTSLFNQKVKEINDLLFPESVRSIIANEA